MKELAFIAVLALSHPTAVKHIEQKYHVEYQGTLDLGHRSLWVFLAQVEFGSIIIAAPTSATDAQFEIAADAAIEEKRFQNIVDSLPKQNE